MNYESLALILSLMIALAFVFGPRGRRAFCRWRVQRLVPALAAQARLNIAKVGTFSGRYMGRRR